MLPERPLVLLVLGALAAIHFLRSGRARSARVAALVTGATLLPWSAGPRGLELVALDVGHGSAVVMRAPGAGVWLFDAGSRDRLGVARGAVAPLVRNWEARALHIVASHADRDHVGALPWIVERWRPALWAGALPAHLAVRLPHDVPRIDLDRGRTELRKGAGERLQVSLVRGGPWGGNEGSRSLLVAYGGQRALLSGDAEAEGLARMLDSGDLDGPFERVLMPHHGSHTRLLGAFLARVEAGIAWSSGAQRPACASALEAGAIPFEWTARGGALHWLTEPRVEVR